MTSAAIAADLAAYGLGPGDATVAGAARLARHIAETSEIRTAEHYVGACERVLRRAGYRRSADWRLVAVGWRRHSPREWVGRPEHGNDGVLGAYLDYWHAAAERPETVGSSYNPDPDLVYRAWRGGLPAWVTRALGTHPDFLRGRFADWDCSCAASAGGSATSPRPSAWRDSVPPRCPRHPGRLPLRVRRRLRNAARAASRTSLPTATMGGQPDSHSVSLLALAALGRISPELQRVAVAHLDWSRYGDLAPGHRRPVRVRDLPWAEIARVRDMIQADRSGRVRAAWAAGRRERSLLPVWAALPAAPGGRVWSLLSEWYAPAYPRLHVDMARRLARGESTVDLADGALTRAEAHEWLSAGARQDPEQFLTRSLPADCPALRSGTVARWLLAVHARGDWPLLTRERQFAGPVGERFTARFLDRVDEIADEDLPRGTSTGVRAAFEAAARRHGDAAMAKAAEDHRVLCSLPRGWRPFSRSMRMLATPAQLAAEGRALDHCVGGYTHVIEGRRALIFSIRVRSRSGEHRSTLEIAPSGRVLQHRGRNNSTPHLLCERVVDAFLERRTPHP